MVVSFTTMTKPKKYTFTKDELIAEVEKVGKSNSWEEDFDVCFLGVKGDIDWEKVRAFIREVVVPQECQKAREEITKLKQDERDAVKWVKSARENYERDRKLWKDADDGELMAASEQLSSIRNYNNAIDDALKLLEA